MVRPQRITLTRPKPLPHFLASSRVAQRRRTFRKGTDLTDRLIGQQQIMWAGFSRDPYATISGSPDQINSFRTTHMNDVQVATDLAGQLQGNADRSQLCLDRPRLEIVPPAALPLTSALFGQGVGHEIILGVHRDRQTTSSGSLHSLLEHFRIRLRKISGAVPLHESLKSDPP